MYIHTFICFAHFSDNPLPIVSAQLNVENCLAVRSSCVSLCVFAADVATACQTR